MIQFKLFKMDSNGWYCYYPDCPHNTQHHECEGDRWYIKKGETCLDINMNGVREVYCRDCAGRFYQKIKPIIDPKLWPFH